MASPVAGLCLALGSASLLLMGLGPLPREAPTQPLLPVAAGYQTQCLPETAPQPPGAAEIAIVPRWQRGEQRVLEIAKVRERRQGGVAQSVQSQTDVDVSILEAGARGYLVRWTFGETRFEDPAVAAQPLVRDLANVSRGLTVDLEVSSDGEVTAVRNWREMRAAVEEALAALDVHLRATGADPATVAATLQQTSALFASEAQIRLFALREISLYYLPHGFVFVAGDTISYDDVLPNPVGGAPLRATAAWTLRSFESSSGTATLDYRLCLDPAAVPQMLADLARTTGAPPPPGDFPTFNVEDSSEFVVDVSTGWLRSATHRRLVQAGDRTQQDTLRIVDRTGSSR